MEHYVYIKSDESDLYFPENKVYKFKVHLSTPLYFPGVWKVGLVEFEAGRGKSRLPTKGDGAVYVFTNICKSSILDGAEKPVLRRLPMNEKNGWSYIFDSPIYLPISKKELIEFEVYIKTDDDSFATYLNSPAYLTLHFKRYPFYSDTF